MVQLRNPKDVTQEFHAKFLGELRSALASIPEAPAGLRVRDWDFVLEEGVPTVQVFLDKGHEVATGRPLGVLLDESALVHRAWMAGSLFDGFVDDIVLEVGSAGAVPHCRDAVDFSAQVGREAMVEFWLPLEGKSMLTGIIEAVSQEEGIVVLRPNGAADSFGIEILGVRRALVDLLKPTSKGKASRTRGSEKSRPSRSE